MKGTHVPTVVCEVHRKIVGALHVMLVNSRKQVEISVPHYEHGAFVQWVYTRGNNAQWLLVEFPALC